MPGTEWAEEYYKKLFWSASEELSEELYLNHVNATKAENHSHIWHFRVAVNKWAIALTLLMQSLRCIPIWDLFSQNEGQVAKELKR